MKASIIQVAADDPMFDRSLAGASISWELVKKVVTDDLRVALTAAGIDFMPEDSSPAGALHRMMQDMFQNRNNLVKPVANPTGSKKPAYAVLPRADENGKMAYKESWSCGIDIVDFGNGATDVSLAFSTDASGATEAPPEVIEDMVGRFPEYLASLGAEDISIWLVSLVKGTLKGIPTIGGAGTFFIGPAEVSIWRRLKTALKPFGIRLYEIPAMRSAEALECVVESVKRYSATAIAELQSDLEKYQALKAERSANPKARDIQQRVLDSREARIKEQLALVERYERLFDVKLDELRGSLSNLETGFANLALVGQAFQEGT